MQAALYDLCYHLVVVIKLEIQIDKSKTTFLMYGSSFIIVIIQLILPFPSDEISSLHCIWQTLILFFLVRLFNNLLENIFQNWIIWSHDWRLDGLETRRAKGDDASACDDDAARRDVEGEGLILQTGNQIHPEHGSDAGCKSDAQTWDFHLQVHFDDFVPGLVLQQKISIKTLRMVDVNL